MTNVDLTVVGFFDEINHVRLAVPGSRPTVKDVLDAMTCKDVRRGVFGYEEKPANSKPGAYQFLTKEGSQVSSIRFKGYKLSASRISSSTSEERMWRFSVLRRAGDRSVLMQNSRNLPFDQFRVEDGDQIFWSLVTVLKPQMSVSVDITEHDQDALIAV